MPGTPARTAVMLAGVAIVVGACWVTWFLLGERLTASAGIGRPDGVVIIGGCRTSSHPDGGSQTKCQGWLRPAHGGPDRPVTMESGDHDPGERVMVRMIGGTAHERSFGMFSMWALLAALLLVLTLPWGLLLLVVARRGLASRTDNGVDTEDFLQLYVGGPLFVVCAWLVLFLVATLGWALVKACAAVLSHVT